MSVEWQFLITLNEQLLPLKDPVAIQEIAVRLLGEHLHANRVNYAHIDGDDYVVGKYYADGVPPSPLRGPITRFGRTIVDACRRGETVAVDDVRTDPRLTDAEREPMLAGQIAAFVRTPLIKDGRWLANFVVHSATPRRWTRDQIALIGITADRTWSAAERAHTEEVLGQTHSRQEFLRLLNDTLRQLTDPERILDETCRLIGTYLHANRVAYGEIKGDECIIVHDYVDGLPSHKGLVQWRNLGGSRSAEILNGWTLSVNDTSIEPHSPDERAALHAAGIRAYICPLLIQEGRFVGAFGIHSSSPRVWTADEIALAQDVADRMWTTIEHRKAEAELRRNEERLAFLLRLNDALRPLSDAAAIQNTAARHLADYLGITRVAYAEVEGQDFSVRREHIRATEPEIRHSLASSVQPVIREALERGQTLVVTDVDSDPLLDDADRAALRARHVAAFVAIPLFKDGRMVSAFGANHHEPRVWSHAEVELIREVAERIWDAIERTRAESALREQATRLSLALQASAGGSWTWDARRNETYWDDTFRAQFELRQDESPSLETWLSRVHPDDRARMSRSFKEFLPVGDRWDQTYRVLLQGGVERWMQSLGRCERDASGRVTRLTGLELDVTERRRAEDARQARRDEEFDRTLRTLLETATQGIVAVDPQGKVVFANRAVESMFGWKADQLIGQPLASLIGSESTVSAVPTAGQELVGHRKGGAQFPVEVTFNHVPTRSGGRVFAFLTDITERQRGETALQERSAELEYRTTQLSRMAWDLTLAEHQAREAIARTLHDGLQQLLVIVALNLEQELKRENDAGGASELLTDAKQQLNEAMAVARSLTVELFPPVLQRSGLPAALTWLANWTHEKYKLAVEISADARADSARKDVRTLLFESVRELLFNAVKYAQTDRITLTLELDADDQLCITVTDEGIGFDPARLDDRSKAGQVGWGLFRIRERLTLLGGRLDVESAPGRGTRIRLVAPRDSGRELDAEASEESVTVAGAAAAVEDDRASPDALRILIVDDHPPVRRALRAMLHQRPQLSVVGDASNGYEAIAHAHTLRPDVILMDVSMPHMDGVDATARIHAELPEIRILGVSMLAQSETADALERAGATGFFVKGSDTQRLIDHLMAVHGSRATSGRAGS